MYVCGYFVGFCGIAENCVVGVSENIGECKLNLSSINLSILDIIIARNTLSAHDIRALPLVFFGETIK